MGEELSLVQRFIIWIPPVLLAITLHEVAHGRVALALGDTTAAQQGRLSLNPLRHIDPIGTVLVPALLFFFGGFIFGWAKPVPVDFLRLRHPKRDMALVALAGPGSNIVMAIFWALLLSLSFVVADSLSWAALPLFYMGQAGIIINVVLAVLNLMPLPPLDGSRVLASVLPNRLGYYLGRIEPFGIIILIGLLATGLLGQILWPPVQWISGFITAHFVFY